MPAPLSPPHLPTILPLLTRAHIHHSADGYLRPSPSPTRLKHSPGTPEKYTTSYSDAESDSGFESGTHTSCISTATSASHREPVTIGGKSEDSESDEDERIEKAILHLDVKVCLPVYVYLMHSIRVSLYVLVLMTSKEGDKVLCVRSRLLLLHKFFFYLNAHASVVNKIV